MKRHGWLALLLVLTRPAWAADIAVPTGASGRTPVREEVGINVKDAGAKCDGSTDDTTAIQNAANAAAAIPAPLVFIGKCNVSGTITITNSTANPMTIRGPGTINQTSLTADTLDLKSASPWHVHDLVITGASTATSGWAINFTNGTTVNYGSTVSNVTILTTANGLLLYDMNAYAVYGNRISANATNIKQQQPDTPSSVESRIFGNTFGCSGAACATHIEFAGGSQSVEVTGNKFLGGVTGVGFSGTVSGSGLVITVNEFENLTTPIDLGCGSGTSFGSVLIIGNHFGSNSGTNQIQLGHVGQASATCPGNVVISGNEIGVGGTNGILANAGSTIYVGANEITGGTNGINAVAGVTINYSGNYITSTTPHAGAGTYTAAVN